MEIFKESLRVLFYNKLFLSMLGIIIGVGVVMTIIAIQELDYSLEYIQPIKRQIKACRGFKV
ncbi:hypothetical protein PW5551_03910 [Petrotoga sp. 9PW.55.5.1]|nr:hypothetical protein PW5551_03910 [Petrotoga sp. 9PW.55.5.1]